MNYLLLTAGALLVFLGLTDKQKPGQDAKVTLTQEPGQVAKSVPIVEPDPAPVVDDPAPVDDPPPVTE